MTLEFWGFLGDDEYKAGPLAEYERRIASGELKPGDEFQVMVLVFSLAYVT